jgi:hypothetical protein
MCVDENPTKKIKHKQISYNPIIREYINDNNLVGLLKKKNIKVELDEFTNNKCNLGNIYEKDVIEYINNNIHLVVSVDGKINEENCTKTIDLMKLKIPFIHSAKFCNNKDSGEIDLLVLNTHINLLNNNIVVDETCNPYYIVIEIKYMKISKIKNTLLIKNTQNIGIAKGQCCYYNNWVNKVLSNNHKKSYIIPGHYPKDGLENIGEIDFGGNDAKYQNLVKSGEEFAMYINNNYKTIDSDNIKNNLVFYPNMNCNSNGFNKYKEDLALELGEHTLITGVAQIAKKKAHNKSIYSFKDLNYTPEQIVASYGYQDSKQANYIKNIITVNRSDNTDIILWKDKSKGYKPFQIFKNENKIFLDFETLHDKIFLTGFYYNDGTFYKYIADNIDSEIKLLNDFHNVYKKLGEPIILYWYADYGIYKRACTRNNLNIILEKNKWVDMYKIFKEDEIAIKDCYNYKLKKISNAMTKHNFINCVNNSSCLNGTDAINHAKILYDSTTSDETKTKIQDSVVEYNRLDCLMIYEIFKYFTN